MKIKSHIQIGLVLILSLASPCYTVGVLGFDLGSEFYKIAVISPGKSLQMVENTQSKTKTNNMCSFYDGDRLLEADALVKQSKKPENSFSHLQKYVGIKDYADKSLQEHVGRHFDVKNAENFALDDYNTILFNLKDFVLTNIDEEKDYPAKNRVNKEKTSLLFEEVLAMIIERARKLSDKFGNNEYPDAVYTVPPWWGPVEREQLASIGELAGINAQGLLSENTGSAVKYAFERQDKAKLNMLLFNMGGQSTKVSVISLEGTDATHFGKNVTKQKLDVLGETWDTTLGAYELDLCLTDMIANRFDKISKKESIKSNPKTMLRVTRESKKFKEVLAANKVTMASIEEIGYGLDFSKRIDRDEFESECGSWFDRVVKPVEEVLKKAELEKSDIDLIEIIGGGVRIPKIQELIKNFMGKDVNMHLNGDDSMALGASLIAANLTTTFRVLVPEVNDGPNYKTDIEIQGLDKSDEFHKASNLMKVKQRYGHKKLINLKHNKDIKATLTIPADESNNKNGDYWVEYQITGVNPIVENPKYLNYTNPTISLGFTMSYLGLPTLNKAEFILEEEYEIAVKYKKEKTLDEKKSETDTGVSSDDSKSSKSDDSQDSQTSDNSDASSSDSKDASSSDSKDADSTKPKEDETFEKMEKRTRKHTFKLDIERTGKSHKAYSDSKVLMKEGKSVLKLFEQYEQNKLRTSESKNRLETLIYSIPSTIEDESIMAFGTQEESDGLKKAAADLEEWFDEDEAYTADWKVFDTKYKDLNKRMKSQRFRKEESEGRDELLGIFNVRVTQSSNNISEMTTTRPWIPNEKIDAALKKIEEISKFVTDKSAEQSAMGLQEDPVLLSSVLKQKTDDVKNEYERLRLIRKPMEKKEKKPEEKKADGPKIDPSQFKMDPDMFKDGKVDDESFKKMYDEMMAKNGMNEEDMKKAFENLETNKEGATTKQDQDSGNTEPKSDPDNTEPKSDDDHKANTEKSSTADL